jgi:hypothetical protein
MIADLRSPDPDRTPGGSVISEESVPPDSTLPPAPPSNCGDVASSATNCGFCGHSCRGDACSGGLCAANVVVEAASIDSFVTDGVDLFTIDANAARSCKANGPATQACNEIIIGSEVGPALYPATASAQAGSGSDDDGGGWGGWGNWRGSGKPKDGDPLWISLQPKAIALHAGGVLIADDAYHVIISCPLHGQPCDHNNIKLIDARMTSASDTPLFGRTLSIAALAAPAAPSNVAWTQGDAIRAAAIPSTANPVVTDIVERNESDTRTTMRIMTPAASDVFWLSQQGLHHSADVNATPQRLFAPTDATDFSVDAQSVYLASPVGIFRIARSTQLTSIAAAGAFEKVEKVAAEDRVYATRKVGSRMALVELRMNVVLDLAFVDGPITGIAVAGEYVYFATRTPTGMQIKRVAR